MCLFDCIGKCIGLFCKGLGKCLAKTCKAMCRCFCNAVSPGAGFLIQIFLYAAFQGFNVGTNVGIFLETAETYERCHRLAMEEPVPALNGTNITSFKLYCSSTPNATQTLLNSQAENLKLLEGFFFFFICLSGAIYLVHIIVLFPNACRHWKDPNFENMIEEASPYYQKILRTHTIFLYTETLVHDIPVACLAVEMCAQMWGIGGVNCWDCVGAPGDVPLPQSLPNCELWLGLLLGSIALVSAYKGILPLYSWIGNPFCWACYPLRILVVLPAGLLFVVLTLCPAMGVAINRLFIAAPAMKAEMGTISDTIWTFGLMFYFIVFMVFFCYWFWCGKCLFCSCECKKKKKKEGENTGEASGCLC